MAIIVSLLLWQQKVILQKQEHDQQQKTNSQSFGLRPQTKNWYLLLQQTIQRFVEMLPSYQLGLSEVSLDYLATATPPSQLKKHIDYFNDAASIIVTPFDLSIYAKVWQVPSVTRCWIKKVTQIFSKVAQIISTAVFTLIDLFQNRPKVKNLFGLFL